MNKVLLVLTSVALCANTVQPALAQNADPKMSFFITSKGPGKGADLGGLAGADAHCQSLAKAVGVGGKTWRAYLSTTSPVVNARDRIGKGPWHNAKGGQVAENITDLHSGNNKLGKQTSLNEKGGVVNGRGDSPNQHDILTGTHSDGRAFADDGQDHTCSDWTSGGEGSAQVGHHDRTGGGPAPTSWNASHGSRGCAQADLQGTGGNGYFYCFAG